jgi:circadian clock protein KaiC
VSTNKKRGVLLDSSNHDVFSVSPMIKGSPTGIVDFDKAMRGGFPKGSVVLIAGSSGSGKTIFCWQWLFHGSSIHENSMYVTLTEPLFNSLKNLEVMSFYDRKAVEDERVKIIDLRDTVFNPNGFDYEVLLKYLEKQVKENNVKRLVIDSITAIAFAIQNPSHIRQFMFELGKVLATLGCTTVLTSEVAEAGRYSIYNVEEFISDVIIRFDREKQKNQQLLRKLNIIKVRGKETYIGELDFKITSDGMQIIPLLEVGMDAPATSERVSIGSPDVDHLLHGGILRGSTTLVAGMTGTGKSSLCLGFVLDGLRKGEPCLYVGFEESHDQLLRNSKSYGWNLDLFEKSGLLQIRCAFPHEKLLEEHLMDIKSIIETHGIKRIVIDSFTAVRHSYDYVDFIDFARRLNGYIKSVGVTGLFTIVSSSLVSDHTLNESLVSTVTDNLITMRHVEMQGELQQVLNIVKIRGSSHSKELIEYNITADGIKIGMSLSGYEGILTGVTRKVDQSIEEKLRAEFKRYLGSTADAIFSKVKDEGLQGPKVVETIQELMQEGVLPPDQGRFFEDNVREIFGPQAFESSRLDDPKVREAISEFFEDKDEVNRQAFIDKYFSKGKQR